MYRRTLYLIFFIGLTNLAVAQTADYYVAPAGNDNNPGTITHPFATFDKARQAVDLLVQNSKGRTRPIVTMFRGGTYYLPSTVTFTAGDSGTASLSVIYQNYPGETPVISGGVELRNWTNLGGNEWQVTLPPTTAYFENLWYNGQRRLRPRLGGSLGTYYRYSGPVYLSAAPPPSPAPDPNCAVYMAGKGWECFDRFQYNSGDPIDPNWQNLKTPYPAGDIEIYSFEWWTTPKLRVASIDSVAHIVYLTGPTVQTDYTRGFLAGHRYLVENVKDAFNQPGQWFLDRSNPNAWTLTYLANTNENPNSDEVIIPQVSQLLTATGLQYVTFQGLTFEHDNWVVPLDIGYPALRQDTGITGVVGCYNCQHVTLDTLTVTQTAGGAIEFTTTDKTQTSAYNVVQNSTLYDLGGFGIRYGVLALGSDTDANVPQFGTFTNNTIASFGRVIPSAIGIVQGDGHDNTYSHNDIYDGYHSGIEVCALNCPPGTKNSAGAFNNISSFNDVHDIGQGVTDDMGCVYYNTNPVSTGNQILNNRCHDVKDASGLDSDGYGGQAYYLDINTSNTVVKNNIAYRISASATAQTCGPQTPNTTNTFSNNILAFFKHGARQEGCATPASGVMQFQFSNNLVLFERNATVQTGCNYPMGGSDSSVQSYTSNLYCYASGAGCALPTNAFFTTDAACNASWGTFADWQGLGQDKTSLVADPLFVNPYYPADNFALKSGSPASQIGFTAFDLNAPGRSGSTPSIPPVAATFPTYTIEATPHFSLTATPSPSTFGQAVMLTATLTSEMGPPGNGESLSFIEGSTTLGTVPLVNGIATLDIASLASGWHYIQASYAGDAIWGASTSGSLALNVQKAPTTTTVSSSINPSIYGVTVTYAAQVSSDAGYPTGTITFKQGQTVLGTMTLVNGVARLSNTPTTGSHTIYATYNPSGSFAGGSASLIQVVNKENTATTVTSLSPNPASYGQAVTCIASVTAAAGVPTGTVNFRKNGSYMGKATLVNGVATYTTTATQLKPGNTSITAVYNGDSNDNTSTSPDVTEVVNQASTQTALSGTPNPANVNQNVVLKATVTANGVVPGGSVKFQDGTKNLGTVSLNNGVATLTTSFKTSGSHSITATYQGGTNFQQSSATLTETVQ